jgi:hypothetical protein
VLLLILLGMIDLGRAFVFGVAVQQGAREAARVGSTAALDTSVTDTVVLQRFILASAPAVADCTFVLNTQQACGGGHWTFTLQVAAPDGHTIYSGLASARASGTSLSGYRIDVRANGEVAMFSGFITGPLSLDQIGVQGDAVMVIT